MATTLTKEIANILAQIADGHAWQVRCLAIDIPWRDALSTDCPIISLFDEWEIRLKPEKVWVDFSKAPELRPTMAMLQLEQDGKAYIVRFSTEAQIWFMAQRDRVTTHTDVQLFNNFLWFREDGTLQKFGALVDPT